MRGPLGIYSPNVDPLTALGIEARSDNERQHVAELQVRMEGQRVQKLLAYQRAYDAAWKRIQPSLPPFQNRAAASPSSAPTLSGRELNPSTGPTDPSRLAVFVKDDCSSCDERVKALIQGASAFDLYMVGTRGDDSRIRAWAQRVQIDPSKVRSGTITLNHDGGRWLSLGLPGSLPAVLHSVNGRWIRD
jgi:integrating conjugative element protein (TIGR03759 family)